MHLGALDFFVRRYLKTNLEDIYKFYHKGTRLQINIVNTVIKVELLNPLLYYE